MANILKGLALLGLAGVAYKYRSEISDEIHNVLPSKKAIKQAVNNTAKSVSSYADKDSYSSAPKAYAAK